jgi:hypothetical protein
MNKKIKELLSLMSFKDERWRFPGTVCDLFTALSKIASYDKKLLQGKPLGKISALLVSIESCPGGPYYSQFPGTLEKGAKNICDRKTNEAIRRFLTIYVVELPNLDKFLHKKKTKKKQWNELSDAPEKHILTASERKIISKILAVLKTRLISFDAEFRERANNVIEKTIIGNPDKQMSLMPYYMKIALGKKAEKIPEKIIVSMGLANIFFWTSFIIYDDFWDEDEAADPRLLPVANLFARIYVDFFSCVFEPKDGFTTFFHQLMDKLDGANAWETSYCRAKIAGNILEIPDSLPHYGDYERKYYPTSGHVLGPLAILLLSGYSLNSKEAKHLIKYFKHYLIAMQMNDDMHDWEEDLKRGHVSTVLDILLRDFGAKRNKRKTINLEKDMGELRKLFWFTTLPKIAGIALNHVKLSRSALLSMKSIENPASLEYFINLNQKIAEKALNDQKESVQFLNAYGKAHTS